MCCVCLFALALLTLDPTGALCCHTVFMNIHLTVKHRELLKVLKHISSLW